MSAQEKIAMKAKLINYGMKIVVSCGITWLCYACLTQATISGVEKSEIVLTNAYSKNRNLVQQTHQHSLSVVALWHVRETYLSLLVDYANEANAYNAASRALKVDEELTLHDVEIDGTLAVSL